MPEAPRNKGLAGLPPHYAVLAIIEIMMSSSLAQPPFDIGGALVEFRRDANLGTKETSTDFRHQLFKGIGLSVCKLLDPLQPLFAAGPMDFMPMSA